jgi:hypothetical protein
MMAMVLEIWKILLDMEIICCVNIWMVMKGI